ncbi:hypothetical protein LZ198_32950 [Myxococcus sp. K15C18031901]|uniref:hypothetical protein n=1 Tax=Myxococcus dinghuensis TaxID=2906761 RepID=UPI0020A7FF3C|nr:hypothetical protein [Myxococcus dinghuensis]MCP3103702.1 hypothetical protein [Myxococcus dinghuensis]
MPDMLAIISKALFEKEAAGLVPGKVLPTDRYRSQSKHLAPLESGGRLFLVTVRPPDEALWLVAVLDGLSLDDEGWGGRKNQVPITDVTALIPQLRFESGKGIQAAKGALGMSLQTPRTLTAADATLLLGTTAWAPPNITAHQAQSPLPCLCKQCLSKSAEHAEARGVRFTRAHVESGGKRLHYWLPESLTKDAREIAKAVQTAMQGRRSA